MTNYSEILKELESHIYGENHRDETSFADNSLCAQIFELINRHEIYKILNQKIKEAAKHKESCYIMNPQFFHFWRNGHIYCQFTLIRKIIEQSDNKDESKEIFSLRVLIDQLSDSFIGASRKDFVMRGLSGEYYDQAALEKKMSNIQLEQVVKNISPTQTSPSCTSVHMPEYLKTMQGRHMQMDNITAESNYKNKIPKKYFTKLRKKLENADNIRKNANKKLLHNATNKSIEKSDIKSVTLEKMDNAIENISDVFEKILADFFVPMSSVKDASVTEERILKDATLPFILKKESKTNPAL